MTFRSAVTASTLFHVAVFLLLAFFPDAPPKPSGTRFYVDYVHLGGGKLPGQKASGGQAAQPRKPARGERSSGKVRELRTQPKRKSELTYTEKERPRKSTRKPPRTHEEETAVVVARKTEKKPEEAVSGTDAGDRGGEGEQEVSVSAGVGVGTGEGTGGEGDGLGDFPYAYYVEIIRARVGSGWFPPGVRTGRKAVVYFRIYRDGQIRETRVAEGSGDETFDLAALRAVANGAPFPRLPHDYTDLYLGVFLSFE